MIEIRPQFLVDMIDVLVVAFLFYRLFAMIKGTRAAQMFVGLVFIVSPRSWRSGSASMR